MTTEIRSPHWKHPYENIDEHEWGEADDDKGSLSTSINIPADERDLLEEFDQVADDKDMYRSELSRKAWRRELKWRHWQEDMVDTMMELDEEDDDTITTW